MYRDRLSIYVVHTLCDGGKTLVITSDHLYHNHFSKALDTVCSQECLTWTGVAIWQNLNILVL